MTDPSWSVRVRRPRRCQPGADCTATYLFVLLYLATVVVYAATPAYFDHVEPSVASVSWMVVRGQPAYPEPESAGMYGLPYGPLLFLLNGLTMKVLGAAIITSKIAGACAAVASLLLVGLAVRQAGGQWPLAMRWTALIYLMFGAASMWVRAEPLLLLSSSLAVLSLTVSRVPSLLLLGLAIGAGREPESQRPRLLASRVRARVEEAWGRCVCRGSWRRRACRRRSIPHLLEHLRSPVTSPGSRPRPARASGSGHCRRRSNG